MTTKQELTAKAAELATEIRAWSESQVHLWQQVPNLCLEANGRSGYSEHLGSGTGGLWSIWERSYRGEYWLLSVDCATGQFVGNRGVSKPASDQAVLALATRLDEIDAAAIIGSLTELAHAPRPSWCSEKEWQLKGRVRDSSRKLHGLGYGIPFTRRQPQPA